MATVRLWRDDEVGKDPAVKAVFDDIRRVRGSDFVNNFWRALANDPANLKRTWESLKAIMGGDGALDPLTRELIYIAVSAANGCSYCIHSHTAAAKQKGMTEAQHCTSSPSLAWPRRLTIWSTPCKCRSIANSWSISDGWRASCHACINAVLTDPIALAEDVRGTMALLRYAGRRRQWRRGS
jgi:AhpD family alkylhydroperoxidase